MKIVMLNHQKTGAPVYCINYDDIRFYVYSKNGKLCTNWYEICDKKMPTNLVNIVSEIMFKIGNARQRDEIDSFYRFISQNDIDLIVG